MPITLTLGQVMDAEPVLRRLAAHVLPVKTAYAVARMLRAIGPEVEHFVAARGALIKTLGRERPTITVEERRDYGDTVYEVLPEALPVYRAQLFELAHLEVEIDRPPLALEGLGAISAVDLVALGPLVRDLEEEEARG